MLPSRIQVLTQKNHTMSLCARSKTSQVPIILCILILSIIVIQLAQATMTLRKGSEAVRPCTLEENLSIVTIYCNSAIATYGKIVHIYIILVGNQSVLITHCPKTATKKLRCTINMIYLCIFSSLVIMTKLYWMVVMDKFSSSDMCVS